MIDQDIAIVGGTGEFGQHLARRLEDENRILISGSSVEKAEQVAEGESWEAGSNVDTVSDADVVIVSVPIDVTVETIHEIGDSVPDQALLCDVTSVKQRPVEAMKEYSEQVLGMHPMYAPSNSIDGQKVVLCPAKGKKWTKMEEFWVEHGADVTFAEPAEHDRATSIVQGLMHFSELVVADVVRRSEVDNDELSEYSTPVHTLITDLVGRMLNQNPGLYRSIQVENPENEEVRDRFSDAAEEMAELLEDEEAFSDRFEEMSDAFDLESAQERSDAVIEHLSSEVRDQ